ncbi:PspC domain-containing protein [Neptunicella marina]|uniref:PspC domain-containing protein n=1 Tax=Neptunicella marina TaxID=2125989 RepID=A0A8J6J062_9ALTE|nr:PspC domain-containing protein [Neptunicella marina]MBC3767538.1 PspC domain-containing protein [Neptunicella marina]
MKDYYHNTRQLYRANFGKKVTGVCAGLARYWQLDVRLVRVAAIVALIFLTVPTAVAYFLATLLLPVR